MDDRDQEFQPAWSPDITRIPFSRNGDIYVMNANGSNLTRLIESPDFIDQEPAWSPDGQQIVFDGYQSGDINSSIYAINVNGSGLTRLADGSDPA
jgi:TolB protein